MPILSSSARHRATPAHEGSERRRAPRFLRTIAAGSTAAIVGATLAVTGVLGAAAALQCPPVDDYKNLHNGAFLGFDNNVNVYAGGDFTALAGAAEAEGVIVVAGDATFSSSYYNLGVAGVGSRVPPSAGTDMLVVGGNITVTSGTLAVADGIGGNIISAGTVTGNHTTSGGIVTQNDATALDAYATIPAQITQASADYAAMTATGTVSQSGDIYFTGDGTSNVQVFEVAGTALGTLASPKAFMFSGIPADATVIINVTGSSAVVSTNNTFHNNVMVLPTSTTDFFFSDLTQRVLWNFPDATNVTLGTSSQLLGSVLIPNPTSTTSVQTSTNGRFLTNGSIVQGGGTSSGLEFHSFPFRGAGTCTIPELPAATGGFSVTKALVNSGNLTGTPATYPIEYSIDGGNTWTTLNVAAGATQTVSGLAENTVVQFREGALGAVSGGNWETPVWSDSSITIVANATDAVTVTNTLTPIPAPTGSFSVTKLVVNNDNVAGLPSSYPIEYSIDGGTSWTALPVAPGATETVSGLPVGTVVQLRETSLTAIPGATWLTPDWTTTSVTIAENTTQTATVTNEIEEIPVAPTTGDFTVSKTLLNPDGVTGLPATYAIEYSIDGGTSWVALPIAAGASATVTGVPAGIVVQLREGTLPAVTDATWQTPSWTSTTLTIVAGATQTASVTNAIDETPVVPATGAFEVSKTLVNDDNVAGVPTTFDLEYSTDGGTSWTSLSVTAGSSATVSGLAAGTSVQLREATLPGVAGATWATPVWTTTTLTIVANDTVDATVTNTITADPVVPATGGFTVTKTLYNPDALAGVPTTFVIEYSTDRGLSWTAVNVTTTTPVSVTGLPTGTEVQLREPLPSAVAGGTWSAPVWSIDELTITAGGDTALALTNEITETPVVVGSFTVAKVLENPDTLPGVPTSFDIEYSIDGGTTWSSFTVAAGSSTQVGNIPVGTVVHLREATLPAVAGGTWATPSWTATSVTIVAGSTPAATVTNRITETPVTPADGGFSIDKTVVNPDAVAGLPATYTVEYSVDGGAWTALTITPGTTATVGNIPAGSDVELREVAPTAIAGATWRTPVWSGAGDSFTISSGTTSNVQLENGIDANPVVPVLGSFDLTKTLVNADALAGVPTSYQLDYSIDGGTTWMPVTVAAGATERVSNIAVGTTVLLREAALPVVAGGTWAAPSWTTTSLTVAAGPTVVAATVTNTITETPAPVVPGFSTIAWVNNDGVTKLLPITGGTVTDRISYTGLTPGTDYRFDGWLMLDDGATGVPIGVTSVARFTPTTADGTMTMDWVITPQVAAANAGQRIVIYLELFVDDGSTSPIADDLDINNPTEWFRVETAAVPNPDPGTGGTGTGTGGLAQTGAEVEPLVGLAALLAALGLGALVVAKRRRAQA